jgi:hypothetical protein
MAAKGSMKDDIAPVKEWWPITQSEELLKLYKGEPNV